MNRTTVTAHAGCMGTHKDSFEAVVAGVQAGADICEVDVNPSSDGTPLLKHDSVLAGEAGLVKLSEVFKYISDKSVLLNLDIKDIGVVERTILEASSCGLEERIFMTGITEEDAEKLCSRNLKIGYYLNHDIKPQLVVPQYTSYIEKLVDTINRLGCMGLNSHHRFCTKQAVEIIHKAGLLVSVWTVDTSDTMKKLLEMGVDNITTNRPDLLLELLNSPGK